MNIDPMSEGLVRQRRNLISISCILIFLKFAGVQISKLTFLGLDFGKLGNPSALYLALWLFFGYFLFRYYQYFSQEGKVKFSRSYNGDLESKIMQRVRQLADGIRKGSGFQPHQLITLQNENWKIRVTFDDGEDGQGGRINKVENIVFPIKELPKYKVVAFTNITLNTSVFTDYILPFLVAGLALCYCLYGSDSSLYEAVQHGFA